MLRLGVCLVAACLGLGLFVPHALGDVSGTFDLDLGLIPEATQTEAVKFFIDLQTNLDVHVTTSGLTFGADLGFGPTGAEFAVLSLDTRLGALSVFDEFVFATPFYNSSAADPITPDELHPTRSGGVVNGLAFVKKRIRLEFNVAGVTLTNLALFEDVDFPNPLRYINPVYHPNGVDHVPDTGGRGLANQTPSFGFGDVVSLVGQTVSGVRLTSTTGLCARFEDNVIKKRRWAASVNRGCAVFVFDGATAKTPLLFDFERMAVEGVELGGVRLDAEVVWTPLQPLAATLEAAFSLFGWADAMLTLGSDALGRLSLDRVELEVVSGNLSFKAFDLDGDLSADLLEGDVRVTLNPSQNPATLTLAGVSVAQMGLVFAEAVFSLDRGPLIFEATTALGGTGGALGWRRTTFETALKAGTLSLATAVTFTPAGLTAFVLNAGVSF